MRIERIEPMDLTVSAADRGAVPTNLGVILMLDGSGPVPTELLDLLRARIPRIPRFRQVLLSVAVSLLCRPLDLRRPLWHAVWRPAVAGKR
ncbi:hypothetical protein Aab01nite_54540 [Paractinoplanes abujensis]|uniref:Uncharacterized protein n=1 Tax=Paractinoplanes abujensis TaxID=882441 RepID=A0A7W7CRT0_9ACTN|nr:hypothetical protein [Actinoplanes abujensis]MBB4693478.1 hypothetical protein [Actinoplanes abujensis]GID21864.1 hypothetical protein Aab01nite_54540 [Actinoplanes abujensis]